MIRNRMMDQRSADAAGMVSLALRLAKNLAADPISSGGCTTNLVFSPLSIYAALALVAERGGATLQELLVVLGVRSRDDLAPLVRGVAERALADRSASGGPAVSFACGIWHDAAWTPRPEFREVAAASYKAAVRAVDFRNKANAAIDEINRWVSTATNRLINSIVDKSSVNRDTAIILANAIYFKGKWEEPFKKEHTMVDKFHRLDGSTTDAQFMRSWKNQFIDVRDGYKVLRLSYRSPPPSHQDYYYSTGWMGNDFAQYSMYVFLPDTLDGLPALLDRVTSNAQFRRDYRVDERVPVGDFRLPKFKLTFAGSISHVLRADMGIKAAFHEDEADLSGMARSDGADAMQLSMMDVQHKAVIEVNEEGTEAAAVTMCSMVAGMGLRPYSPPRRVDFVADHPFMFFVIEEVSNAIVFAGTVLDPSRSG